MQDYGKWILGVVGGLAFIVVFLIMIPFITSTTQSANVTYLINELMKYDQPIGLAAGGGGIDMNGNPLTEVSEVEFEDGSSQSQAAATSATYVVCASDARNVGRCDFLADGVQDEVTIQAAFSALPASGGSVCLSDGIFNISVPSTLGSVDDILCTLGGTKIKPANGVAVTIGSLSAPVTQVFDISAGGSVGFATSTRVAYVYPEWWGASGDGTTDDGAFVQAAIDSFPKRASTVVFTGGEYQSATTLITGFATRLWGWGAFGYIRSAPNNSAKPRLQFTDDVDGISTVFDEVVDYRAENCEIRDLRIAGTGPNNGAAGIHFRNNASSTASSGNVGQCKIIDNAISNWQTGIDLGDGNDGSDSIDIVRNSLVLSQTCIRGGKVEIRIVESIFTACSVVAISLDGTNSVALNNEIEPGNSGSQIGVLIPGSRNQVIGNIFFPAVSGVVIYGDYNKVTDNVFRSVTDSAIVVGSAGATSTAGSLISDNLIVSVGGASSGNRAGIDVQMATNLAINDNTITSPAANARNGIIVGNASGAVIQNIKVSGNSISGGTYAQNLIRVAVDAGTVNQPVITDNLLNGTSTSAVVDLGSATNAFVRNNTSFITESQGTATVTNGNTSVAVSHGLSVTPAAGDCSVTATNDMGNAAKFFISTYTSTQFTITVDADPGAGTATFAWTCAIY